MKPVIVIGHRMPDTDSICSAICYARLKQKLTGREHVPCRAGQVNPETQYVLDRFGVEPPRYLSSLHPRLADVQYRAVEGITSEMSLRRAWQYMIDTNIHTIPVVGGDRELEGLFTLSDIVRFYMEGQDANSLATARTSYRNLVDVLGGELVVGDIDARFEKGKVVVAAANPDVMEEHIEENDLIILGNRYESQLCSIEMKAGCIVIGLGAPVSRTIKKLAEESGCAIIATPMDTYACAKVIDQAVPVEYIMKRDGLVTFRPDDLVEDVKRSVAKKRIRYYPILDDEDKYVGMVSQRNLLDVEKQEVILVDHNERDQAVEGILSAHVTEIIDHHRIGTLETNRPIYFRNQPLGCTATIVTQLYREHGVEIDPQTAGLLCSAILSDTLLFRSPTCTAIDRAAAEELAQIAGIDVNAHAMAMFRAGSQLGGRDMEELIHIDQKSYQFHKRRLAVAQVTSVDQQELDTIRPQMLDYIREVLPGSGMSMLFVMLTNIIEETTDLVFAGEGTADLMRLAFQKDCGDGVVALPGVVSRKKQLVPALFAALEREEIEEG